MSRLAALVAAVGALAACAGTGEEPGTEGDATSTAEGAAGAAETSGAAATVAADTIHIRVPGLHPEGIEWDGERDRFLVSSVTTGTITAVTPDGEHRAFIEDPDVSGAIGIHVDDDRGRLLVANSLVGAIGDPSASGQAKLGIYDLASGERLRMVDLGALRPDARHFANDMTVGPDGTIYITDSLTPVIYRIGPDGEASVPVEDERLMGEGFGLNGIDWHPDGYLLVAVAGRRELAKVPVDRPGELSLVALPEPVSADGLYLQPDGTLVAVGSTPGPEGDSRSEVLWLRSDDGWSSAEIAARAPAGGATTGVVRDGEVWVVNPHFEAMGGDEPRPSFEIYRVEPAGGE